MVAHSQPDTFNEITRGAAWDRMSRNGAQLMSWFGVACELHRDWRNDIEGLGALFSNHIPDYRNLIYSYNTGGTSTTCQLDMRAGTGFRITVPAQ